MVTGFFLLILSRTFLVLLEPFFATAILSCIYIAHMITDDELKYLKRCEMLINRPESL